MKYGMPSSIGDNFFHFQLLKVQTICSTENLTNRKIQSNNCPPTESYKYTGPTRPFLYRANKHMVVSQESQANANIAKVLNLTAWQLKRNSSTTTSAIRPLIEQTNKQRRAGVQSKHQPEDHSIIPICKTDSHRGYLPKKNMT